MCHVQRTHITNDIAIIDLTVLFHLRIDCSKTVTALIDCHTTFQHVLLAPYLVVLYQVVLL
jgi:hypothetical protein